MTVVIDTNVVLPILGLRHPYSAILDAWVAGRFAWAITTAIVLEYEEIVQPHIGPVRWRQFMALLEAVEARRRNLLRIAPQFRFLAIPADPDDNKFADRGSGARDKWQQGKGRAKQSRRKRTGSSRRTGISMRSSVPVISRNRSHRRSSSAASSRDARGGG